MKGKNSEKSELDMGKRVEGLLEKEREKRHRLKELGINYTFPGFVNKCHANFINIGRSSRRCELSRGSDRSSKEG